jgi:Co/Zn/Cd efflux system component
MNFGFHRAEVLGALGSIVIIWILTGVLLFEAVLRFFYPPQTFDAFTMMVTALLGIIVNIIMGLSLHQGSHKHYHAHIFGGSCNHDHGSHNEDCLPETKYNQLVDLKDVDLKASNMIKSKSVDFECSHNLKKNSKHHHHKVKSGDDCEDQVMCCELSDCDSSIAEF